MTKTKSQTESGETEEYPGPPGEITAYFDTPEGSTLRIRAVETEAGYTSKVELVEAEAGSVWRLGRVIKGNPTIMPVFEGGEIRATQIYNGMVEPLIREELEAVRELKAEAESQGDSINYINHLNRIRELKEELGEC